MLRTPEVSGGAPGSFLVLTGYYNLRQREGTWFSTFFRDLIAMVTDDNMDLLDLHQRLNGLSDVNRRQLLQLLAVTSGGLMLPGLAEASLRPNRIKDIRVWTAPDHSRVVFDLERPVKHTLFRLKNPDRVVLDIDNATLSHSTHNLRIKDPVVRAFRMGIPRPNTTRAVFELNEEVRPRSFLLKATKKRGPRLVIDLYRKGELERQAKLERRNDPFRNRTVDRDEMVVVIDPGHGGEDPGAVGRTGVKEKDVVLTVAKKLANMVNATPGYRAHLTRKGDYYVSLKKRVGIARQHDPDLFMSLHADSFRVASARGTSVYCLSEKGKPTPDRAIKDLVERENNTDLVGGVNLGKVVDPEVAGILMDLSQRDSLNRSLVLGRNLLDSLDTMPKVKLHYKNVKQAGFAVLKAPDIPSVLVELAFLSNPHEERLLKKENYQATLAKGLFRGVERFARASRVVT
ncbi:N-acetylmuramoyl-L-alanine amidase [Magnetococcus sp. PR-3]|uniref:N-acetylmuramoyl-L-alanine amidase n=1 Tax=Magnetococcus sp. PR-3 TaxID=3120355 RepID=UPI002FCE1E48